MNEPLTTYNEILFVSLRPWIFGKQSDQKFKEFLLGLKKEHYINQPHYEVGFEKPLSSLRKYYQALIDNTATKFLNDFHNEYQQAANDSERKYLIHHALTKALPQKLNETQKVISTRHYSPDQFDIKQAAKLNDKTIADESYVLHNLKHQLVRLVMEIQEAYIESMQDEHLLPEEIYYQYFDEAAPNPSYINQAINYPDTKQSSQLQIPNIDPAFNPLRSDIRESKKGVCTYEQMIKNPSRFADFECKLFENSYIDKDYNFTNKHGEKRVLAAIYHQLIRKNYFNQRIFPENKTTTDLLVRKFLDHRYNTNVDKQFRTWANDQESLLRFIESQYWLDNLLPC